MGKTYDTAAIRADAMEIRKIYDSLSETYKVKVTRINAAVDEKFTGEAATAMRDSVEDIRHRMELICVDIYSLSKGLDNLATRLEMADAEAAELIAGS